MVMVSVRLTDSAGLLVNVCQGAGLAIGERLEISGPQTTPPNLLLRVSLLHYSRGRGMARR